MLSFAVLLTIIPSEIVLILKQHGKKKPGNAPHIRFNRWLIGLLLGLYIIPGII